MVLQFFQFLSYYVVNIAKSVYIFMLNVIERKCDDTFLTRFPLLNESERLGIFASCSPKKLKQGNIFRVCHPNPKKSTS